MSIRRFERRLRSRLSHYPVLYAFIAGVGIILFWRGVWHSADVIHGLIQNYRYQSSLDLTTFPLWDGPISIALGVVILHATGAFVSSFIGNELILSGLRGERKLTEQTEHDVHNEVRAIADIKDELVTITKKLEELERHVHHKNLHS